MRGEWRKEVQGWRGERSLEWGEEAWERGRGGVGEKEKKGTCRKFSVKCRPTTTVTSGQEIVLYTVLLNVN